MGGLCNYRPSKERASLNFGLEPSFRLRRDPPCRLAPASMLLVDFNFISDEPRS